MSNRLMEAMTNRFNPDRLQGATAISPSISFNDLDEKTIMDIGETSRTKSLELDVADDKQALEELVIRARDSGYFDGVFSFDKRQKLLEFLAGPEPTPGMYLEQGNGKIDEYTMHHVDIVIYTYLIEKELEKKGLQFSAINGKGGIGKTAVSALIASVMSVIDHDTVITDINPLSATLSDRLCLDKPKHEQTYPNLVRNLGSLSTAVATKKMLPKLPQTNLRVVPGIQEEMLYEGLPLGDQHKLLQVLNDHFRNQIIDTGNSLELARMAMANTNSYGIPVLARDTDGFTQSLATVHNLSRNHKAEDLLRKHGKIIITGVEEDNEIFFEDEEGQRLIKKFIKGAYGLRDLPGVPEEWRDNPMLMLKHYGFTSAEHNHKELDANKFLFIGHSEMLNNKNGDHTFSVLPQDMGYRTYIDTLKAIYSFLREDSPTETEKSIDINGSLSSAREDPGQTVISGVLAKFKELPPEERELVVRKMILEMSYENEGSEPHDS